MERRFDKDSYQVELIDEGASGECRIHEHEVAVGAPVQEVGSAESVGHIIKEDAPTLEPTIQRVYIPWRHEVMAYPDRDSFFHLRTWRNHNLVSEEESAVLYDKTVAGFGLSVGSNVLRRMVKGGIGSRYVIGDPDIVTYASLNRTDYTTEDVGLIKHIAAARRNGLDDPFATQIVMHEGFPESADRLQYIVDQHPDIFIEEMDDVHAKARARRFCADHHIPLVMVGDLGQYIVIDVERHDREDIQPFNGRVPKDLFDQLASSEEMRPMDEARALKKIAGAKYVLSSERMMRSILEAKRDKTLGGIPQLGEVAVGGAALATTAIREILLGNDAIKSGTYALDMRNHFRLGRDTSIGRHVMTLAEFMQFARKK